MFVIHAPGGRGYFLVKNTTDTLSTHEWHHGNFGLQAARKFRSVDAAKTVIRSGFRDAGGHLAGVFEVKMRGAYCAKVRVGQDEYWLCAGRAPYERLLRWRRGAHRAFDATRFRTSRQAQSAAESTRLPEGAHKIEAVRAWETYLV